MELRLDAAKWRKRKGMRRLLRALRADEGLTRYVGGAVRDELLGFPVSDVDLATRIRPEEVVERLEGAKIKVIPTGIDHGTVTAVSDGQVVEVTSLRRDVSTDGRRATVAYTDDWKEDAARRDFTINALSADPATGEIFDYFGGLEDLEGRHIRFIGDPLQRIAEDHLRILRFFRFHARFGSGEPDAAALDACTERANDLMALSRERIADELLKLAAMPDPAPTFGIMLQRGILKPVLPEIEPERLCDLEALIAAEGDAGIEPAGLRRLSALLPRDPLTAEKVAARLKLSNRARKRLACAASPELFSSPRSLAYRVGSECAVDRLLLAGQAHEARAIANWKPPRLPVSGGSLIARGLVEGPIVAKTLRQIEQRWVEAGFPAGDALETIVSESLAAAKAS
jgi:poly(A) polymerase